jgi:hypothetical protein
MKYLLCCLMLVFGAAPAVAQTNQAKSINSQQVFGHYTVHFSVFNSSFLTADTANAAGLTRARDQVLINISVTDNRNAGGVGRAAEVSGTATNLIQQQRVLAFKTITEGDAFYYIAPLRHTNEEVMNFAVDVRPEGEAESFSVRFTRTLYVDGR